MRNKLFLPLNAGYLCNVLSNRTRPEELLQARQFTSLEFLHPCRDTFEALTNDASAYIRQSMYAPVVRGTPRAKGQNTVFNAFLTDAAPAVAMTGTHQQRLT